MALLPQKVQFQAVFKHKNMFCLNFELVGCTHSLCRSLEMESYMHQNADKLLNRSDTSPLHTWTRKQKAEGTGTMSVGSSRTDYMSSRGFIGRKILPSRQLKGKNWRTGTRQLTDKANPLTEQEHAIRASKQHTQVRNSSVNFILQH